MDNLTRELLSECCDAPPWNPNGEPDRCGHCRDNATFYWVEGISTPRPYGIGEIKDMSQPEASEKERDG